jgi:hypothetical protein
LRGGIDGLETPLADPRFGGVRIPQKDLPKPVVRDSVSLRVVHILVLTAPVLFFEDLLALEELGAEELVDVVLLKFDL